MRKILARLRDAARADPETVRFEPTTEADIQAAEDFLGLDLPDLLKRSYLEIGNGGFGPGPLIGLPGGYESSWGNLLQSWMVIQEDEDHESSWLPIADWGCGNLSLIDCDDHQMVTHYEGEFHHENYSFEEMLVRWVEGKLPGLHDGEFRLRSD